MPPRMMQGDAPTLELECSTYSMRTLKSGVQGSFSNARPTIPNHGKNTPIPQLISCATASGKKGSTTTNSGKECSDRQEPDLSLILHVSKPGNVRGNAEREAGAENTFLQFMPAANMNNRRNHLSQQSAPAPLFMDESIKRLQFCATSRTIRSDRSGTSSHSLAGGSSKRVTKTKIDSPAKTYKENAKVIESWTWQNQKMCTCSDERVSKASDSGQLTPPQQKFAKRSAGEMATKDDYIYSSFKENYFGKRLKDVLHLSRSKVVYRTLDTGRKGASRRRLAARQA